MSTSNVEKLMKERSELMSELSGLSDMLHGSWVERYSLCSNKNCKCRAGERHGPRCYLVINENGRQRQKYIPVSKVEAGKEGVRRHKRLMEIVDEITLINLQLIKEGKYGEED